MQQAAPMTETAPATPLLPGEPERAAIRRALAAWTGDATVAEDLTQETLVEAWRSAKRPDDPDEQRRWLFGVARNVLLRWRREQARYARLHLPASEEHLALAAADVDLESELDDSDLVDLLDAALATLPRASRQAILLRYVDELPQADIARRLGLTEGALEGRLHRGKLALRRHFVTEQPERAASLGLLREGDQWVQTRIRCDSCGVKMLEARWGPGGFLALDCAACAMIGGWRSTVLRSYTEPPQLRDADHCTRRSFKPILNRLSRQLHEVTRRGIFVKARCEVCDAPAVVERIEESLFVYPELSISCSVCGAYLTHSWIAGATSSHPAIHAFSKDHAKMRFLPRASVEHEGRPTYVMAWESFSTGELIEALRDEETLLFRGVFRNGVRVDCDQLGFDPSLDEVQTPYQLVGSP